MAANGRQSRVIKFLLSGSSAVLTMGVPLFFVPVRNTDHNCGH